MRLAILVLLVTLLALPAFAIYVPADGTAVTVPVTTGWYNLCASGTFFFSYPFFPEEYADAEWEHSSAGNWTETRNYYYHLSVNGSFSEWKGLLPDGTYEEHAFSPTHVYKQVVYAENELTFSIWDSYYADNTGGLNVTIEPVPEPASLLALGGAVGLLGIIFRKKRGGSNVG